jgi:hypothetical protein
MSNVLQLRPKSAMRVASQTAARAAPAEIHPADERRLQAAFDAFEKWAATKCLGPPDRADVAMFMIQVVHQSSEKFTYEQLWAELRKRQAA